MEKSTSSLCTSESEVITPVGARSPGRRKGEYSYYAGKTELIAWVNHMLELDLTRLDEFASGAVYCQILDAYFPTAVAMHKVNFHAREEYEFLSNYNQLHGAFTTLGITREINVQKLMRGSPSDGLELLQWLYKFLKKKVQPNSYLAKMRRCQSHKGGTDSIPTPSWLLGSFNIYGKVPPKPEFHSLLASEPATPPLSRSMRVSKSSVGPRAMKSSLTRSKRVESLPGSLASQRPLSITPTPELSPSDASLYSAEPPASPSGAKESGSPSPVRYSADIRSVSNEEHNTDPDEGSSTGPCTVPSEVASSGVNATTNAIGVLDNSLPNFTSLVQDVGANDDSYAYRGKVRSMRDVMNTLLRHTSLLLDDLNGLENQEASCREGVLAKLEELRKALQEQERTFTALSKGLSTAEKMNPVPHSSTICITEKQKKLSDTQILDSALRRVGAAQAALAQALLKGSMEESKAILNAAPAAGDRSADRENSVNNHQGDLQGANPPEAITHTETTSRTIRIGDYQIRRLKNGDIYKGRYVRSKKNGEGVYQFMNGDVYEGDFKDDRMGGYGLYTFSHEGRYEGHWANAVYEGVGTETFARGSTYHGEYSEGMRNGWGVCRYYNGDYYEGNWKRGLREGRGMQQCTDDSNYVGDYVAGKRHGHGVYSFPNGDRYLGEYERDIPHGCGVYMFASGQKYEGHWHSGKKHGWCIYTIETGEMWAGEWLEGKPKWVQGLVNGEEMDERWPAEICEKVSRAWMACRKAQEASVEGSSRADDHWDTDGPIQAAIRYVVLRADEAAAKAQLARKRAVEVASKLDALAAEQAKRNLGSV